MKPNNVFVGRDMQLKIGDLGLAVSVDKSERERQSYCGTPAYMAPEVVKNKNRKTGGTTYGLGIDVWALGLFLY
jgi:cell cycle serine/threonine-protein kinase CDC5/MSD2